MLLQVPRNCLIVTRTLVLYRCWPSVVPVHCRRTFQSGGMS